MNKLKSLFYLFFPIIIGSLVAFLIKNNIDYQFLIKPPFAPPKILFPIAWTIIYLLMGLSFYLYKKNNISLEITDFIYYLQLFINALWSIIFFNWKLRLLATIWIIFLDIVVLILLYLFSKQNKLSMILNIPYLIWILFATYLTTGIYILN